VLNLGLSHPLRVNVAGEGQGVEAEVAYQTIQTLGLGEEGDGPDIR